MAPYQHALMVGTKNRLLHWRRARKLSQEQLGEAIGLSYTQIGKIERGEQGLREDVVWKIVKEYKCHPGELFAELPKPNYPEHILELASIYARLTDQQRDYWLRSGQANATPVDSKLSARETD